MSALRRIAVLRALGGLGDVLCVVPALKRLRHANVEAHITYIGLPQVEGAMSRYPGLVDRFLAFPGFPGIPEHPFEATALCRFLEDRAAEPPFDLVIQMHGSGAVSNVFAGLLGAARTAGYYAPGLWRPNERDYSPFPDGLSELQRWSALVARLGFDQGDDRLDFPVSDEERASLARVVPDLDRSPYAVIHVGASDPRRRWPTGAFAEVADDLARRGVRIVLTGTPSEAPMVARVCAAMSERAIDLCGRTTLGEVGALIERAALVVTNDTGTSNLAAALQTPSVVIFIASDPARWAPGDDRRHIAVGVGVPDVPIGRGEAPLAPSHPSIDAVMRATPMLLEYA